MHSPSFISHLKYFFFRNNLFARVSLSKCPFSVSHASLGVLQLVIRYNWGVLTFSTNTENAFSFRFSNSALVCAFAPSGTLSVSATMPQSPFAFIKCSIWNFHVAQFSGPLSFSINSLSSIMSFTPLSISHKKSCVKKLLAKIWAHNLLKFHVFYYRQDWQKKKNKEAEEELLWHNVISTTVTPIGKLLYYNSAFCLQCCRLEKAGY